MAGSMPRKKRTKRKKLLVVNQKTLDIPTKNAKPLQDNRQEILTDEDKENAGISLPKEPFELLW